MLGSQEIGLSLISFQMILEALQSSAIRIHFSFAKFKNPKNPGIQPIYKCHQHFFSWETSPTSYPQIIWDMKYFTPFYLYIKRE